MTPKERFLKMKSYEEFEEHREELKGLKFDKEILEHISRIFPKPYGGKEELYRNPPGKNST